MAAYGACLVIAAYGARSPFEPRQRGPGRGLCGSNFVVPHAVFLKPGREAHIRD